MKRFTTAVLLLLISTTSAFCQQVRYNGDVEAGVLIPSHYAAAQINVATSHGAYFTSPGLFIGAGAGIGFNIDAEYWNSICPVYADIRKDFALNRRFTTFIDAKVGYSLEGGSTGVLCDCGVDYGFYCYPSVGLRFATSQKCGVYLKLGYTYQASTLSYGYWAGAYGYGAGGEWISGSTRHNAGGFSASIGFSFQ